MILFLLLLLGAKQTRAAGGDCFSSTIALFHAQVNDMRPEDVKKEYVLCPNTTIEIGIPVDSQLTEFVNGDFPLVIVRDNVSILCGEDGSSANNCVLSGGMGHIYAPVSYAAFGIANATVSNLHLKGLTLQGTMVSTFGIYESFSIFIAAAGENLLIEDCHWRGIRGVDNLLSLGRSLLGIPADDSPAFTVDVTIRDCSLAAIVYNVPVAVLDDDLTANDTDPYSILEYLADTALLYVSNQSLTIERTTFTNIQPSSLSFYSPSFIIICVQASCFVKDSCFGEISFFGFTIDPFVEEDSGIVWFGQIETENLYLGPTGYFLTNDEENNKAIPSGLLTRTTFSSETCAAAVATAAGSVPTGGALPTSTTVGSTTAGAFVLTWVSLVAAVFGWW